MESWWEIHSDYPYPSEQEKKKMRIQTGMTFEEIDKWIENRRIKYLYEIYETTNKTCEKNKIISNRNSEPYDIDTIISLFENDKFEQLLSGNLLHLGECVSDLLYRLTNWRQLVFFIDHIPEECISMESYECLIYACNMIRCNQEEVICVDLLHHAFLTHRFIYARTLMYVGVPLLPLQLPDCSYVDVLELSIKMLIQ